RAELQANGYVLFVPHLFENGKEDNNIVDSAGSLIIRQIPHPDLQVTSATGPAVVSAGSTAQVDFTVINQGSVPTDTPFWNDKVYLSLDNTWSYDDRLVATVGNGS